MNLKRAMNDDVEEHVETVNGNKIRKQSEQAPNESEGDRIVDKCSSECQPNNSCCVDAGSGCSTSVNNLNGSVNTMNNLNSHNFSNGYSSKFGESSHNQRNGQSYNSRYRQIFNSSSSEDDDEHCVYTYKGAEVGSDLPDSFLYLGMNVPNGGERNSLCSSPDMDYLEMDFDPGPSNGQDSDSDNNTPFIGSTLSNERKTPELPRAPSAEVQLPREVLSTFDENANFFPKRSPVRSNEKAGPSDADVDHEKPCCSKSLEVDDVEQPSNDAANLTINSYNSDDCIEYSSEDEELPCDRLSIADVDLCPRKLSEDSDKEENIYIPGSFQPDCYENQNHGFCEDSYEFSLLDSNLENSLECYDDLLPVDPSYSISAVANVIKLLRISDCTPFNREFLADILQRKQIPNNVSLVEYLYMRAVQNANENDLANFSSSVFPKKLYSRFFSTYPNTDINLLEWLNIWMRRGAVPVVTRNVQKRGTLTTKNMDRNPWKHNVVYKLDTSYVHLSNPNEKISESLLYSQLSQAPLIFVKRTSVLKRWTSKVDLRALMRANHNRWYNENVLGQVATVIREHNNGSKNTQYVRIPSNCNCGITLFVPSENLVLCKEVDEAQELPLMCC